MIQESKCCNEMMKKRLDKELVMTKEDKKDIRTLQNVGSLIMIILTLMLK